MNTGLLLKARMVNERNETIEQFAFTQLQIGGHIHPERLKASLAGKAGDWRVHDAKAVAASLDDSGWVFRNEVPGFKKSAGMRRQLPSAPDVLHFVFSDGLAAVSVFVEPLAAGQTRPEEGMFASGAINIYKRVVGDHLLVVLGEVPPLTLKRIGDGAEPRRR
jgi:sigma-E factor negative regulatory protein RseB